MRWLSTLSRIAFICNAFFVLAFSLQLVNWLPNADITATIVVIGYFLAFLVNPLVNLSYLLLFVVRKAYLKAVPLWLLLANFAFLIFQIFYIIYLNDPEYH